MNLNQLVILKAVVEQGNFSKAAAALELTNVAVSKQIKSLENDLNITLFERHSKKMHLTDIGRTIYERALIVLNKVHDIRLYAEQLGGEPVGELKISCHTGVSETLLLPHLTEFIAQYPKMTLDLSIGHHFKPGYTNKFDILFGIPHYVAERYFEDWNYKKIVQGYLSFCASKKYLNKHGMPKTIEDLSKHRYLQLKQRYSDPVLEACQKAGVTLNSISSFDDTAALIYAAVQGMGLVIVPDTLFNINLSKNYFDLTLIPGMFSELKNQSYDIYLLFQQTKYPQPKVTAFNDFIMQKLDYS